MDGYRISEAARATGFTESALRFYEQEGVVVPRRTDSGYRAYGEEDIDALLFVARAKRLGLRLEEITDLLGLLATGECAPVQARLRELVGDRIEEAHRQVADLVALTAQLQQAAVRLEAHTPEGACDDRCGCRVDPPTTNPNTATTARLVASGSASVACSLQPGQVADRVADWRALVAGAESREPLSEGLRLRFGKDVDVVAMARLAAAEQECCSFFAFSVGIDAVAVTLDVTGPPEAQSVIAAMFGVAA